MKILFLAANPKGQSRLRLDEEYREICASIQRSEYRDNIEIEPFWATRVKDMAEKLVTDQFDIIHFSGHGNSAEGIGFDSNLGKPEHVLPRDIVNLFETTKRIKGVIYNACYSMKHAEKTSDYIHFAIGTPKTLGDKQAIEFSKSFYFFLGGKLRPDFLKAYTESIQIFKTQNMPEINFPQLFENPLQKKRSDYSWRRY